MIWAALTNQASTFPAALPASLISILLGVCYYPGHHYQNTHQMPYSLRFCVCLVLKYEVCKYVKYVKCWLYRKHEGCYTQVALPLYENETIIEQPLDTWSLKDRYARVAVKQIFTARYVHRFWLWLYTVIYSDLDTDLSSFPQWSAFLANCAFQYYY